MLFEEQVKRTVRVPAASGQDILHAWLADNPQVIERAKKQGIKVELPDIMPSIAQPHEYHYQPPPMANILPPFEGGAPMQFVAPPPWQVCLPPANVLSSIPTSPQGGFPPSLMQTVPLYGPHLQGPHPPGPHPQGPHPPGPHQLGLRPTRSHPLAQHSSAPLPLFPQIPHTPSLTSAPVSQS